jgi:hypothetical protein
MMYASRSAIVALLCLVLPIVALPAQRRSLCDAAPAGALVPSRDLYCLSLVASPGVPGVSGHVELGRARDPFTIAVTADGRIRYAPTVSLAGLPDPSSRAHDLNRLARDARHIPVVRLSAVRNGDTKLPSIDLDKVVVLAGGTIGDAAQPAVTSCGESPSSRLQRRISPLPRSARRRRHNRATASTWTTRWRCVVRRSVRWTTVPMPANLTMLPGEMALRPEVAPYCRRAADAAAPARTLGSPEGRRHPPPWLAS